MDDRTRRAAAGLGVGAAASTLLAVPRRLPWHMVGLGGTGYLVALLLAAAAVAAAVLRLRLLLWLAGAGFAGAAVLVLVQIAAGGANTLGGETSTVALFLGFAVGLLAVAAVPATDVRQPPS